METFAHTAADVAETAGDVARELEPAAVAVFVGAGLVILAAEVLGIARKGKRGDTISEMVWWTRDRLPGPLRFGFLAGLAGFFTWLVAHFAWGGS